MVSSRSQASGWCLRVQVVEAGPSRIPFQYPCLCYLLTWVFSIEFSNAPNLYGKFISSLHSPYSHRLPHWPRSIRKLTFVCLVGFWWINLRKDRRRCPHWLLIALYSDSVVIRHKFSYGQEDQTDPSLQPFSHCPSCLCCGTKHPTWLRIFSFHYKWQNKKLFSLFKNWHPVSKLDSDLNSDLKSD